MYVKLYALSLQIEAFQTQNDVIVTHHLTGNHRDVARARVIVLRQVRPAHIRSRRATKRSSRRRRPTGSGSLDHVRGDRSRRGALPS